MINIYTGIVSSPIIQGLFSAAREVNPTTQDSWEDLTVNNCVLDDRFYFVGRDTSIPYTSSARSINLQGGRQRSVQTRKKSHTMQLPANLCPPTCEFFNISALRSACKDLSCVSINCSVSVLELARDSREGSEVRSYRLV